MKDALQKLLDTTLEKLQFASDIATVNNLKFEIIDKKDGEYAKLSLQMRDISKEERPEMGKFLNQIKQQLDTAFAARLNELKHARYAALESEEREDMTFPVPAARTGHIHPITQAYFEIVDIFGEMGFSFAEGPEVEWFWYAFESLNMPSDHPASDDFETYYVKHDSHDKHGRMVLRPHTSPVQIRSMQEMKPPIRVVVPGKTYRPNYDTSHTPMFHQFEGLLIDRNVSIGTLVGTLDYFVKKFFGKNQKVRIRPYHFQFTEPSFEVDISCSICGGEGCRLCKEGWLELGGAGMVHPVVLENGGVDSTVYNGFAFGWGIERCVNIRSGIPDVRMIYEGELRLLEQF